MAEDAPSQGDSRRPISPVVLGIGMFLLGRLALAAGAAAGLDAALVDCLAVGLSGRGPSVVLAEPLLLPTAFVVCLIGGAAAVVLRPPRRALALGTAYAAWAVTDVVVLLVVGSRWGAPAGLGDLLALTVIPLAAGVAVFSLLRPLGRRPHHVTDGSPTSPDTRP